MNQQKPILHARDHLPGGADPIPGICIGCGGGFTPADLVSLWPLDKNDSGTTAHDVVGPNDGTYVGGSTATGPLSGEIPPIRERDADSGYFLHNPADEPLFSGGGGPDNGNITVVTPSALDGSDPFTAGAWVRVEAPGPKDLTTDLQLNMSICGNKSGWPTLGGWELYMIPNGDIGDRQRPGFRRGSNGIVSPISLAYDRWYWIAGVYDGSTMTLYLQGKNVGSTAAAGALGTPDSAFRIGCGDHNAALSGGWRYMWGQLAYVFYIDAALTSSEIAGLWKSMGDPSATLETSPTLVTETLVPGENGQVLTTAGGEPTWAKIVNDNVDAAASIAGAKLALTGYIANTHVAAAAAIDVSKLAAGTNGQVLTVVAGVPAWATPATPAAQVAAREGAGSVYTRSRFQFNDTSEVGVTVTDDSANNEIDVEYALGTVPLSKLSLSGASEGEVLKITSGAPSWEAPSAGGGVGTSVDVQTFAANGTWNKPTGALWVEVVCVGGGGGGGGGRGSTNASLKSGGGGGGGGALTRKVFRASDLPATLTVTVGGAGGAGPAGTNGGDGGNTTCVNSGTTYAMAGGGAGGGAGGAGSAAGGGGGGAAGGAVAGGGGTPGAGGLPRAGAQAVALEVAAQARSGAGGMSADGYNGSPPNRGGNAEYGGAGAGGSEGSNSAAGAGGSSLYGGAAGGGGGGTNATPATSTPGAGGQTNSYVSGGGGAAGTSGASPAGGGNGGSGVAGGPSGSGGGGGGAGTGTAVGTTGGNGGVAGGGGGGGGAGVTTGGAGGAGGRGEVRIASW